VKDTEGEDSFSLLSVLTDPNKTKFSRKATIHHSITGEFAIREGDWKLIVSPSSGGWSAPKPNDTKALKGLPMMQLYNLKQDPGEKNNLYAPENEKAKNLLALLRLQISNGRSTPGDPQTNEVTGRWKQLEAIF
jgi:arylsulfatase A-like enzyme